MSSAPSTASTPSSTFETLPEATGYLARAENAVAILILGIMVSLATLNALSRLVSDTEIPGAGVYIQHLNLLLTFAGALIATRIGRHLTLSTGHTLQGGKYGWIVERVGGVVGGTITAVLAYASFLMALAEKDAPNELPGGIPVWIFQLTIPLGFALMSLRFFWHRLSFLKGLPLAIVGVGAMYLLGTIEADQREWVFWPLMILMLASSFLGAPIFTLMSGAALLLFFSADVTVSAVPAETYHIVVSPTLPVIPLFTFAGYLLARGGASKRLVDLFNTWFGWMPGGVAIVAALVCAFFTTFTGASGVTILGMGGLLLPLLVNGGYSRPFSLGLLTTAGSLGMLFPPSLPVILYGVMAGIAIDKLFLAGILPGLLMIGTVSLYGVVQGLSSTVPRAPFSFKAGTAALWQARYELLLPLLLFSGLFGIPGVFSGFLNLAEAAALTAVYILTVECLLTRELKLTRDVPSVMLECTVVIGALLIIFGAALGMTNYLVDAEIPVHLTEWVKVHIHERWLFILTLNLVLLVVGSMMEGFSAIVILVPLISPIGQAFGLNPIHLGILFLANLEVGFLLPPVGLNLFLSSLRFNQPLVSLYRPILPFFLLMAATVLIISYVPALSLVFIDTPPMPK